MRSIGDVPNIMSLLEIKCSSKYHLALGNVNGDIELWNFTSRKMKNSLDSPIGAYNVLTMIQMEWDQNKSTLISGGSYSSILIWDIEKCQCIGKIAKYSMIVNQLLQLQTSHSKSLVVGSTENGEIILFDIASHAILTVFGAQKPSIVGIVQIVLNENIIMVASAGEDSSVRLWDLENAKCMTTIQHANQLTALAHIQWKYDSTTIITAGKQMPLRCWNIETGELLKVFGSPCERIICMTQVTWTRNDSTLACSSLYSCIALWDLLTYECLLQFKSDECVFRMRFSEVQKDKRNLIFCLYKHHVEIYDIDKNSLDINPFEEPVKLFTRLGHSKNSIVTFNDYYSYDSITWWNVSNVCHDLMLLKLKFPKLYKRSFIVYTISGYLQGKAKSFIKKLPIQIPIAQDKIKYIIHIEWSRNMTTIGLGSNTKIIIIDIKEEKEVNSFSQGVGNVNGIVYFKWQKDENCLLVLSNYLITVWNFLTCEKCCSVKVKSNSASIFFQIRYDLNDTVALSYLNEFSIHSISSGNIVNCYLSEANLSSLIQLRGKKYDNGSVFAYGNKIGGIKIININSNENKYCNSHLPTRIMHLSEISHPYYESSLLLSVDSYYALKLWRTDNLICLGSYQAGYCLSGISRVEMIQVDVNKSFLVSFIGQAHKHIILFSLLIEKRNFFLLYEM